MNTAAAFAAAGEPVASALARFELLPSLLFHPARRAEWLPSQAGALADGTALHRHASAGLLRRLGLARIADRGDPALPVCAAPDPLFGQLTLACGLVLLGPMLRRMITRGDVRQACEQLGTEGLSFARGGATFWDAEPAAAAQAPDADGLRLQALRLGEALVAAATDAATGPVGRRGLLRLPADAPLRVAALPPDLQSPSGALGLVRRILAHMDPTWHSSFPDPR
mgnify:CR=1 FL=1